jgi:class III poly(R)-hydroxyalkanoic acid synthase PhaE subunit
MSHKNTDAFWNTDWMEQQRQYLEAWQAFNQFMPKSPITGKKDTNPLTEAMEYWWKSASPSMPEGSTEFLTKMMEQGRVYYILSEQFSKLLKNINELSKSSEDWQSALNDQFEELKKIFVHAQGDAKTGMGGMFGAWQMLPLDNLQRAFSSASVLPGDFLEDLKPENIQKVTDKFLSIPGVGYTRETQEQIQDGIRLWNNYQKVSMEYNHAMANVSLKALDMMRNKIIHMAEEGKEIHSLREIYDLLVDCGEEAYAEFTYTKEFSDLYGRLTNALMAVKHHGRNIVDEMLGALNMPTRRGMNTVLKRHQEMHRESKLTSRKLEQLQEDMTALKRAMNGNGKDSNRKSADTSVKTKEKAVDKQKADRKNGRRKALKKNAADKKSGKKAGKKTSARKDNMIVIKI